MRMGGVIFSNYTGESIAMHSAAWDQHWINRDMLFVIFDYPFNQLGVKRMFGQVPRTMCTPRISIIKSASPRWRASRACSPATSPAW